MISETKQQARLRRGQAMKRTLTVFLLGCALAVSAQPVNGPKLMPVSDWDKDNTLSAYQGQMLDVIRARDHARLFDHLDPNIRFSFPGASGIGIRAFERTWYVRPHWDELYRIFFIGGGSLADPDHFVAPSVYANWPEQFDRHSFGAVILNSLAMRETPNPKSKMVAVLHFDIVEPLGEQGHIRLADGRTGWVDPRFIACPTDVHVVLVRERGTWQVIEFAASGPSSCASMSGLLRASSGMNWQSASPRLPTAAERPIR